MPTSRPSGWLTACSPSPPSTRCGATAPARAGGFRFPRGRASTPPIPTPGSFRSAPGCGRSSRTSAASRPATSSSPPTAGSLPPTAGSTTRATLCWRRSSASAPSTRWRTVCTTTCRPGRDCRACHEGNVSRVLGFSALQLSGARDPGAPHAEPLRPGDVDLAMLVRQGWVKGLPAALVAFAPEIPARSATERAALGYLHGNCANCHNARGPLADLDFSLEVRLDAGVAAARPAALATGLERTARFQPSGSAPMARLAAGPSGGEPRPAAHGAARSDFADASTRNQSRRPRGRGAGRALDP